MATVYLATDLRHHREVALKVLRPELSAVLGGERFLNEVRITARLDHPHIVTLIDSGESDGRLWYVLPYIRGESLRQLLQREKQLGLDQALTIARQIAGALDYAHKQGVVHRDIKPENILLHEGEAMLADFGIALAVKEAGGNRLTETGLSLGTPQYMSPEQATGDRTLDARSDVYSLAAVVYEMLAGEPPVTGPTVQAVIAKLLTERPTHLRVVRDTVPEGVDSAVAKALAKIPADRFASAAEFAQSLVTGREARGAGRKPIPWPWLTGAAGLALIGVLVWLLPDRAASPMSAIPQPRQVTFTGNASAPALSPDGQRIAYAERSCDAEERCVSSLVVQDVNGAGSTRPATGFWAIYNVAWSPDGRYLIALGTSADSVYGSHLIPALGGGAVRLLPGANAEFFAGSDSIISAIPRPDGTVTWVTAGTQEGLIRDSANLSRPGAFLSEIEASPDGRMLAALGDRGSLTIFTRDGRVLDTLPTDAGPVNVLDWSPDGRGIIFAVRDSVNSTLVGFIEREVNRQGRLTGKVRVLVPPAAISEASVSAAGIAYAAGPVQMVVHALTRPDAKSSRLEHRRLGTSTGWLTAAISPRGDRVILERRTPDGTRTVARPSLIDFAGGAETPIGPIPGAWTDLSWSPSGDRLVGVTLDQDRHVLLDIDPDAGRTRPTGSFPVVDIRDFDLTHGWLPSWVSGSESRMLKVQDGDGTTRTIPLGHDANAIRMSPFADEAIGWGWKPPLDDTLQIFVVDLAAKTSRTLVSRVWEGVAGMHWVSRREALLVIRETVFTSAIYSLDVAAGALTRHVTLPFQGELFATFSNDGRRMVVRTLEPQQDVWIVKAFEGR
jgi:Tol biopolymer transport system component